MTTKTQNKPSISIRTIGVITLTAASLISGSCNNEQVIKLAKERPSVVELQKEGYKIYSFDDNSKIICDGGLGTTPKNVYEMASKLVTEVCPKSTHLEIKLIDSDIKNLGIALRCDENK